ncbi:methyl-accepting chemotaxis protein [Rhizobium sp. 9140]|uniref:methyl-accepting chemotaxis protein n=1 Tax=Rhizobium sp. 9140 TaxID=1761900 RepID=UPI0007918A5B|nr:methyl-accepting chemotaxis protein [Rhizobium sp. 9140]CZT37068.1 methyl-accepting chemotaxis protein [Rhizobium sp. 9140]
MWLIVKNLSVSRKLFVCFSSIVLVVSLFCGLAFWSLTEIRRATAENHETQSVLKLASDILATLVEQQNAMRGYVASTNGDFLDRVKKYGDAVGPLLQELQDRASIGGYADIVRSLPEAVATFNREIESALSLAKDTSTLQSMREGIAKTARLTRIREVLKGLTDQEQAASLARNEALSASFAVGMLTLLVGGLLTVLISFIVGMVLARGLGRPIVEMTDIMRQLAGGKIDLTVPAQDRRDEIGAMAKAVDVFRANAAANARLEDEAEAQRTESERNRLRLADEEKRRAAEMRFATAGLARALDRLAQGDLTTSLDEPFAPEFETIRTDFNKAVAQLGQTLTAVSQATAAMDNGTREISDSTNDLSRRTEQQAASLEETAAALDQITVNVANASKRSEEARSAAASATVSAEQSGQVVASTVHAMERIEKSSSEISNIIGVIDEIAFQTNLLALNAGVEAARAGEAGKGFAVVAQEVRELAQRSAKAAKEIKDLIRASTVDVANGVKLVSETGTALRTIEGYIVSVNQHMNAIATSAREQAAGLAEVNTAVNQMDQVTQQNAAMVEESSAAGAALASESAKLRQLIARFELRTGAPMSVVSGRVASTPVPTLKAAPVRRSMSAASHANAALKDSWEEF